MTITEYIDISDPKHLRAVRYLFKKGVWPKAFVARWPRGLVFPPGWPAALAFTLAEKYVDERSAELRLTKRRKER